MKKIVATVILFLLWFTCITNLKARASKGNYITDLDMYVDNNKCQFTLGAGKEIWDKIEMQFIGLDYNNNAKRLLVGTGVRWYFLNHGDFLQEEHIRVYLEAGGLLLFNYGNKLSYQKKSSLFTESGIEFTLTRHIALNIKTRWISRLKIVDSPIRDNHITLLGGLTFYFGF